MEIPRRKRVTRATRNEVQEPPKSPTDDDHNIDDEISNLHPNGEFELKFQDAPALEEHHLGIRDLGPLPWNQILDSSKSTQIKMVKSILKTKTNESAATTGKQTKNVEKAAPKGKAAPPKTPGRL